MATEVSLPVLGPPGGASDGMRQLVRSARGRISTLAAMYKYFKLLSGRSCRADLKIVSIEFCSVCNLSCRYCDLQPAGRPAFLDIAVFEKLLAEISATRRWGVEVIEWPISGEFLLHPRWREAIDLTRRYLDANPRFRPWIILNDNMMVFDREKVDYVLGQRVFNQIICSIDGRDKESLEYMRPRSKWERVVGQAEYLVEANLRAGHPTVIEVNNGCDHTCVDRPLDPRLAALCQRVDHVRTWEPTDWNESFHGAAPQFAPARSFCTFVLNAVTLSTSGALIKCCMDLQERTKYADFTRHSLDEIWHSAARKRFLGQMYRNRRGEIPFCKSCSIGLVNNNNRCAVKKDLAPKAADEST